MRDIAHGEAHGEQRILIGTAGWSLPSALASSFETAGTHLQRYARRMHCAEINSSFYRPHRPTTYAKWAASVPEDFRFSVKLPRTITHAAVLFSAPALLREFLTQVGGLGSRLGSLLIQLPPRRAFAAVEAAEFLTTLRTLHPTGTIVLEPRHATWFSDEADALLLSLHIGRVAADPALLPAAARPGGDPFTHYFRLHGSPHTYYSAYSRQYLQTLARALQHESPAAQAFVVFDNTAAGAALRNALQLQELLLPASTASSQDITQVQ